MWAVLLLIIFAYLLDLYFRSKIENVDNDLDP